MTGRRPNQGVHDGIADDRDPGHRHGPHRHPRGRRFTSNRRLRAARRLQLGGAGRPRRLDRLAVPAALRQPGGVRPHPRPRRRALDDHADGRRSQRAPLSAGNAGARDDVHDRVRQRAADRRDGVRRGPARARARPRRAAPAPAAGRGHRGRGRAQFELAPRPEYGLVRPLFRQTEHGGRTFGGPNQIVVTRRRAVEVERLDDARDVQRRAGRAGRLRACSGRRRMAPRPSRSRLQRVAERIADTVEGWRSWEAEHDVYDGPAPRARAAQLARAEGADLPADRRDRRRAHDVAARDGRRRAQLGLPVRLGARRELDDRGALHRRLPGRGRGLRLLHDQLRRRPRQRSDALQIMYGIRGEHYLPERELPHLRGWRDSAPGARRQRRLGPDAARRVRRAARLRSTCTASSSASCIPRSSGSSPTSRTPPRGAGARPTRGCGRCAASRATTSPPR